jgi:hypothetical protein
MKQKLDYRALVAEYERGTELTQTEFCERRGAVAATFRHWLYRIRREPAGANGFVPLNIVGCTQGASSGVVAEVAYPCGTVVRLWGASQAFVAGLVPRHRP